MKTGKKLLGRALILMVFLCTLVMGSMTAMAITVTYDAGALEAAKKDNPNINYSYNINVGSSLAIPVYEDLIVSSTYIFGKEWITNKYNEFIYVTPDISRAREDRQDCINKMNTDLAYNRYFDESILQKYIRATGVLQAYRLVAEKPNEFKIYVSVSVTELNNVSATASKGGGLSIGANLLSFTGQSESELIEIKLTPSKSTLKQNDQAKAENEYNNNWIDKLNRTLNPGVQHRYVTYYDHSLDAIFNPAALSHWEKIPNNIGGKTKVYVYLDEDRKKSIPVTVNTSGTWTTHCEMLPDWPKDEALPEGKEFKGWQIKSKYYNEFYPANHNTGTLFYENEVYYIYAVYDYKEGYENLPEKCYLTLSSDPMEMYVGDRYTLYGQSEVYKVKEGSCKDTSGTIYKQGDFVFGGTVLVLTGDLTLEKYKTEASENVYLNWNLFYDISGNKYRLAPKGSTDTSEPIIVDQEYTGEPITPEIDVVRIIDYALSEAIPSSAYTVTYENNVEPGIATIIVKGLEPYFGERRLHFVIYDYEYETYPIRTADVWNIESKLFYTGSPVTPKPTLKYVKYDGSMEGKRVTLVEGEDYIISGYENNNAPGKAKVILQGINKFYGTKEVEFEILSRDTGSIYEADVTLSPKSAVYDGLAHKPSVTVTYGGKVLKADTDYTLEYSKNDFKK